MLLWRQAFGTQCFCLPDMWFYMLNCFSRVWFFGIPWAVAHQAPLSMGFSRQEHWSGLPFPSPGTLPNPGIKPASLRAPALAGEFSTTRATWVADESGRSELCIPSVWRVHIIVIVSCGVVLHARRMLMVWVSPGLQGDEVKILHFSEKEVPPLRGRVMQNLSDWTTVCVEKEIWA